MPYAHAVIDAPDGTRYQRGDEVDESKFDSHEDELTELREGGAVREDEYDPAADEVPMPDVVVIDGVEYKKAVDASEEGSNADLS